MEDIREKIKETLEYLKKEAEDSLKALEDEVANCDFFRFSFRLGDIVEYYGAAIIARKVSEEFEDYFKDAANKHEKAYRYRDAFSRFCKIARQFAEEEAKRRLEEELQLRGLKPSR